MTDFCKQAKKLIDINIAALERLKTQLDGTFSQSVSVIVERLDAGNKIIVTGLGKSYHIGQKLASTLTSTGSPAFMLHPAEAMHGDVGVVQGGDAILALSYSGESRELITLLPYIQKPTCILVAITGNPESALGKKADFVLPITTEREACPFNLAPTTSALLTLAIGDALAMLIHQARGFTKEDYAKLHPGGAIGNTLTVKTKDIMRKGDRLSSISESGTVNDAVLAMTQCRSGATGILDKSGNLVGVFTDGDFRRLMGADPTFMTIPINEVMNTTPVTIFDSAPINELQFIFNKYNINCVMVVDSTNRLVGASRHSGHAQTKSIVTELQAIILGVVEGLTEYLPVSSTGHLILSERLMGIGQNVEIKAASDAFVISIQAGAIIAVLGLYCQHMKKMLKGLFGKDPEGLRLFTNICLAFLPAAAIGLCFINYIKAILFGLWPIVIAWFIGGIAILIIDRKSLHLFKDAQLELYQLSPQRAFLLGCIQCLAMWPGVSRSLVTILGGRFMGLSMQAAIVFSFILGMVTLGASTFYDAIKHGNEMIHSFGINNLLIGLFFAFLSAVLAIKCMVTFLHRHGLALFGYYRIILSLTVALFLLTNVIS